jgi:CheY-like chemotaxis protein
MKQMRPHSVLKKPETGQRILLVEDDTSMGFLLTEFLEHEGYEVKLCRDGLTGLAAFQKNRFDLCILDVMMTQMDGFALAQKIRSGNTKTPFLFLTARSLKEDKLKGFALGAEDYITKPLMRKNSYVVSGLSCAEVFLSTKCRKVPGRSSPSQAIRLMHRGRN